MASVFLEGGEEIVEAVVLSSVAGAILSRNKTFWCQVRQCDSRQQWCRKVFTPVFSSICETSEVAVFMGVIGGYRRCRPSCSLPDTSRGFAKLKPPQNKIEAGSKRKNTSGDEMSCASRESNAGPIDGNDGFYH
ncbi:hypothetical protein B0T16DRAFT_50919 [Cercophora newfieldiana]|uniref:Uncharacterized protein n=1 Tax=Cercophora newfieldiana TaxID=92897 RepID=A0AA39YQZ3_9PEZI|nr:hypothetical protein B0T16DRAFT_50919 [Cercophora newfieldiana]